MTKFFQVISAIEDAAPLYEEVNRIISLGRDRQARAFLVENAQLADGLVILDWGVGPASLSKIILAKSRPENLVGLDISLSLLKLSRTKVANSSGCYLPVRGMFEAMPFRAEIFDRVLSSFALRDALDLDKALAECRRVLKAAGIFGSADIGKPSHALKRFFASLYVHYIMPAIAKILIRGKVPGNPWRMIIPTYDALPTTRQIHRRITALFGSCHLKQFLTGGIVVFTAPGAGR